MLRMRKLSQDLTPSFFRRHTTLLESTFPGVLLRQVYQSAVTFFTAVSQTSEALSPTLITHVRRTRMAFSIEVHLFLCFWYFCDVHIKICLLPVSTVTLPFSAQRRLIPLDFTILGVYVKPRLDHSTHPSTPTEPETKLQYSPCSASSIDPSDYRSTR